MKIENYDFKKVEKSILTFWKNNKIYEKQKALGKGGKTFTFLQGPPYTSGRLHTGHIWNSSLKDMALRYKRRNKFDVWDRAGYDMHGLPTEHQVQKLHNLKTKEDIKKFGVMRFANECIDYSKNMAKIMDDDLLNLGIWMDYSDPYYPINNDFIEGEWWLVKKVYEKGRLYKGKRALGWCASCGTALAKHEQEYKTITDNSIYVKFKVKTKQDQTKNDNNEYLIIWTTTPWTITFNLAVMVNPDILYSKIKVNNEVWIVASDLANQVAKLSTGEDAKVLEEFKGEKLEGLEYDHPWENEIDFKSLKEDSPKIHTIILSKEYVDISAGTGLVHCAPGCGPEDYEVGHKNNILAFNTIDEYGVYPESMGKFKGWIAKKDDKKFISDLEERGALIKSVSVSHEYPHCERCKNPLVFRSTDQWFFKIEDLVPQMKEDNKNVHWVPESGKEAYDFWLENLRDNSITKQRFWGTPAPIWECDKCMGVKVIGGRDDIEKLGGNMPQNLHKPWIDEVKFECECGGTYNRIDDILDVWIDSATVGWNCFYYPKREDLFKKYFPIDLIVEAKEQVRLWFYMLHLGSTLTMDIPCYKNVHMHGMLFGVDGVKMSKSLGNIISPYEISGKYGIDTMRSYFCSINAGTTINFSWQEIENRYKNFFVSWNLHKYLIELAQLHNVNPRTLGTLEEENLDFEERYIFSKLNSTMREVENLMDNYHMDKVVNKVEDLFLTLSRTYVQLVREKANSGVSESSVVIYTLYKCFREILSMYSLCCPFISEAIYQNMKEAFGLRTESLQLLEWNKFDESKIDIKLERNMEVVSEVIQSILSCREKIQISRRWPLKEVVVETVDESVQRAVEMLEEVIKKQTNVKSIRVVNKLESIELDVQPNFRGMKKDFGDEVSLLIPEIERRKGEIKEIYSHIEKTDSFLLELDNNSFKLEKKHFTTSRNVPYPYKDSEFKFGVVYANQERTPELELEGFVREIMRRIQDLRKKSNLDKTDKINLSLRVPEELVSGFKKFDNEIIDKIGVSKLSINESTDEEFDNLTHKDSMEVKNNKFEFGFNVCG